MQRDLFAGEQPDAPLVVGGLFADIVFDRPLDAAYTYAVPEHLEDASLARDVPSDRRLQGQVRLRELLGSEVVVHFEVDAAPVVRPEMREIADDIDAAALTDLDRLRAARRTAFVGRFSVDSEAAADAVVHVAVAPAALRFFDPETGLRIGVESTA